MTGIASGFVAHPGVDPGFLSPNATGSLDLKNLMPSNARRPREGIQPDTYPFETLVKQRASAPTDTMGIMIERMGERMGELSSPTKDLEIERFHEYVVFAMRGFGDFATTLGTGLLWV